MILAGVNAVWGGVPFVSFVNTKAQDFDGSFDYDIIRSLAGIDFNTPKTIFIRVNEDVKGGRFLSNEGNVPADDAFYLSFGGSNNFSINIGTNKKVVTTSNLPLSELIIIVTTTGLDATGTTIYVNNVDDTILLTNNALTYTPTASDVVIGDRPALDRKYNGRIASLEIIDENIGAGNIATATTDLTLQNVASDVSKYLLAIDFTKNDGEDPTTFTGTPSYTIDGFGGTTYVTYP